MCISTVIITTLMSYKYLVWLSSFTHIRIKHNISLIIYREYLARHTCARRLTLAILYHIYISKAYFVLRPFRFRIYSVVVNIFFSFFKEMFWLPSFWNQEYPQLPALIFICIEIIKIKLFKLHHNSSHQSRCQRLI